MTARPTLLAYRRGERASVAVAAAIAAVVVAGCAAPAPAAQDSASAAPSAAVPVGECVALHGDGQREALRAAAAGCDAAMSYTVSAHTDIDGDCPPPDGYSFVEPFADRLTARLCLVPNLAVGHCYTFGVPTGRYELADCATSSAASIRIEERFDLSDTNACTDPRLSRAMVYRSVPRIYCVSYPGIEK